MCYNAAHKYMAVPGSELTAMVDIPTGETATPGLFKQTHWKKKIEKKDNLNL